MTTEEKQQTVRDYFADITLELAAAVQLARQGDWEDARAIVGNELDRMTCLKAFLRRCQREAKS